MWVRPNFATGPGRWSAPHLFSNLTPTSWHSIPVTQLTSRPTLGWDALPEAVKYDLWVNNLSSGPQQLIRQYVTGTTFTPPTDLAIGMYRAWIRGVDAKGNFGTWSTLQRLSVVPAPVPVGPLSATFDRTPTFTWNPVAGAAGYELYVKNQNTGAMVINGTSVTGTSFTPTTDLTDGPYRWWTIAVSPVFSTGAIKSGGASPVDLYVGGRPTIIAPAIGSSTSDRTPTFTWRAVDGAVRYQLLVNRIDVPQSGLINQTALTTTSFTPATDLPAGTYHAWVKAVSATDEVSTWSVQIDFTVTVSDPDGDVPEFDDQLLAVFVSLLKDESLINGAPFKVQYDEDRSGSRDGSEWAELSFVSESMQPDEVDRLMMTFDDFEVVPEAHHDEDSERNLFRSRNPATTLRVFRGHPNMIGRPHEPLGSTR